MLLSERRNVGAFWVVIFVVFLIFSGTTWAQSSVTGGKGGAAMSFALYTKAFAQGGEIPAQFTCSGADASPALTWDGAPQDTQAFALIVHDPDAPSGDFTHWVIYDIPAKSNSLAEGAAKTAELPDGTKQGRNGFGRVGYGGPCPPPGKPHRYFFKLYALDAKLGVDAGASRSQLEQAMKGHVLAEAGVMGTYRR